MFIKNKLPDRFVFPPELTAATLNMSRPYVKTNKLVSVKHLNYMRLQVLTAASKKTESLLG
jgi:hypothetical protein